jgi:outer membrane usher protein
MSALRFIAAAMLLADMGAPGTAWPQDAPPGPVREAGSPAPAPRLLPLEVILNGANVGSWVLLESRGQLYAPAEAFEEWRVNREAGGAAIQHRGQTWYPLSSIPGFEANINLADQSLDLKFSAKTFASTHLVQQVTERAPLTPAMPAAFLNYDLSYTTTAIRGIDRSEELGALTEAGFSSALGVLTASFVGRNLTNGNADTTSSWRRLETTFTRDFPDSNTTLRLGDTATRASMWGRSVYFAGVQIGRNFGFTPGFVTQPIPVIEGTSTTPSTVELYINDALRQTSSVPTGPFTIDNFPLLTGSGQARVVVRDLLGRETVVVQPFFTHSALLEQGLSDWSVDAGAVRRNLGIDNANYGEGFASGLWRHGVNKSLTLETRGELGVDTRGGGVGFSLALPWLTLGQAALAGSHSDVEGDGTQWLLGLEHRSLRHGFTLRSEGATRDYRWIGMPDNPPYRQQLSASYSYSSERFGSIGAGLARIEPYDQEKIDTYSLNYSARVGKRSALTFTATHVDGAVTATSVGASFVMPLDNRVNVSGNLANRDGQTDGYVAASRGLTAETGTGWRVLGGSRNSTAYGEGGLYYQGSKGLLTADASAWTDQQTLRVGAQGGMVAIDGRMFASRTVQDSFALVEVPGYADVGVGFQGSKLTRTDKDGIALLPRLQPFQNNSIRLDPSELPISAELDSIEQVVVPAWRSAVKVAFPVRTGRGALITLVLDDDEPAPAGAEAELVGDDEEFFVARRGEAFITGLQARNQIRLKWNGASCTVVVELPPGAVDEIARIGPLKCSGVKR